MASDGLTMFHVKFHLKKYRIAMADPAQGESEKRTHVENVHLDDVKSDFQIKWAPDDWRLNEQLEIWRKLQLRIEEQEKKLKMMFGKQHSTCSGQLKSAL
ncbi:hypothetical protein TSUD_24240 [Trifolium subterraneum]|uniref:MYB-CC type transcription factor LHEQLE-containing domain-containing protein n=1 Tax=Trifolium subterraneum TaxID=3900 RepID=A0A2Z6P8K0_TRISU|nr:hypothetical protein TSUD_24240 [Trifolium subterraneum]